MPESIKPTPSTSSYGVKPMNIRGPYKIFQSRIGLTSEFTHLDRKWRNQFLKDQVLSPKDGSPTRWVIYNMPEFNKDRYNIFRRTYMAPFNFFEKLLHPALGYKNAYIVRNGVSTFFRCWAVMVGATYYLMYHTNNWEKRRSVHIFRQKPAITPDSPHWPDNAPHQRTRPSEYAHKNFDKALI